MSKIIVIANQKGGVSKTTTSGSLAAGLSKRGKKVLLIDFDPQGNLSEGFGADNFSKPTIYEVLRNEINIKEAIQKTEICDIIPANILMSGAEQEFTKTGREHLLRENVDLIKEDYDYIIIDTPPALNILTVNAFTAADEIIIPTMAERFAAKGINQLNKTVESVKKYCNPNIKITGVLLTRFNPRSNINKEMQELTEKIGKVINVPVFKTYIRSSVAVVEAQSKGMDIFSYRKDSTVSKDYEAFIEEYLNKEEN